MTLDPKKRKLVTLQALERDGADNPRGAYLDENPLDND